VKSGRKAIEVSNEGFFNVALIDIRLPDIEGTKLLEKLKRTEPRMVKIIVTGYPFLKNAVEAVSKGVDGCVLEPFDAGELLAMIEEHLKRQRETMKYSDEKVAEYIETRVGEVELGKHKRRVH